MLQTAINLAILVAFVIGSVGFIGNNISESRRGVEVPVLRWMRNAGLIVIWPLIIIRAVI